MTCSRFSPTEYENLSMYGAVAFRARQNPRAAACRFMGRQIRYQQLMDRIELAAKALCALGIGPGDRVTICMPNSPQAVECLYGLNRLGAVANVIHPLCAPEELRFHLTLSSSKAILTLDQFYPKVAAVTEGTSCRVLVTGIRAALPFGKKLVYPLSKTARKTPRLPKDGYILWEQLIRHSHNTVLPPDTGTADTPACILYSGGTTGAPKGIVLTNKNFNSQALQTLEASGYTQFLGDRMLAILPIFHGFGLGVGIHTPLIAGACSVLVPQFSLKEYTRLLKQEKPAFIPGVPTLFEALLRAEGLEHTDLRFLKGIFCGGDTLPYPLKVRVDQFLADHGCREQIREGYGMTECVSVCCLTPREENRPGSIGLPFPQTQFKIVKPGTQQPLPAGQEGELCISGPTVMQGYLDDPEETRLALQRHDDGQVWLHTADLGCIDPDGFIRFTQRLKRMIVTSGYNVYPTHLESIITQHPKVRQCCVIGVKDPYRVHRVKACIVLAEGVTADDALEQELLAYCAQRIAKYAMPRQLEFRKELPKTSVGKVDYRALEMEAEQ